MERQIKHSTAFIKYKKYKNKYVSLAKCIYGVDVKSGGTMPEMFKENDPIGLKQALGIESQREQKYCDIWRSFSVNMDLNHVRHHLHQT